MNWQDAVDWWGRLDNYPLFSDEHQLMIVIGLFSACAVLWLIGKTTGRL